MGELDNTSMNIIEPSSVIYMIVGPHSGFTLDEIIVMKQREEERMGYFYWGYAGTLCYPLKVQAFAQRTISRDAESPTIVMVETKSRYISRDVGVINKYSIDGREFQPVEDGVTLIGCTIAVTCRNLRKSDALLDMNRYLVADGKSEGRPMGEYIRHQVNKACAFRRNEKGAVQPRHVRVFAVADLVEPYCVYLSE